jgi:hypothetical protein
MHFIAAKVYSHAWSRSSHLRHSHDKMMNGRSECPFTRPEQPIGTASADQRLFVGKSFVALEIQLCAQLAGVTAQVISGSQLTHQG